MCVNINMFKKYSERNYEKCQKWITNCLIYSIFCMNILPRHGINANILPDENGKLFISVRTNIYVFS